MAQFPDDFPVTHNMRVSIFLNKTGSKDLLTSRLKLRWVSDDFEANPGEDYLSALMRLDEMLRRDPPADYFDRALEPGDVVTLNLIHSFMKTRPGGSPLSRCEWEPLPATVTPSFRDFVELFHHNERSEQ